MSRRKCHFWAILVMVLASLPLFLRAQEKSQLIDTLIFANFHADTLIYSSDTSLLPHFFYKLDSVVKLGRGRVNIVHIGGSHVQAGTLPHRIRQNILRNYPFLTAGRGLIFPYAAAAKCNNPADYSTKATNPFSLVRNVYKTHDKPLGVAGIAVYTQENNNITIRLRATDLTFPTTRITLLGKADSGLIVPMICHDSTSYAPTLIDTALNRYVFDIQAVTDSFLINFDVDSGNAFTVTGILLDNDLPGITYHSIGVNGASLPSYLRCADFDRDVPLLQPDLVIFGIGINDAYEPGFDTLAFEQNYLALTQKFRAVNPNCAFIFMTNNDSYRRVGRGKYSVNRNGLLVQRACYRLAARTAGAVWDQFHIMGGLKSMYQWQLVKLAQRDKIHFTRAGYQLIGDLFYNAFIHAKWKETATCGDEF